MFSDDIKIVQGLNQLPPLPDDLAEVELSDNSRQVLMRRYVRRSVDGSLAESIEEMFWRVAYHIALMEQNYNGQVIEQARKFYDLMISKKFFPNSPTFTGAGTPLGQLAACFVLKINDDLGKEKNGIFETLRDAALIQQTGGGNGFSFSQLRPKGTVVKSSAGQATGPVGFLRVYDKAFAEVAQGGTRRGASMAVLRVDHPDIEEFISCKTDEDAITNFNISVGVTDAFMQAVEKDDIWELRFPDVTSSAYSGFEGTLEQAEQVGIPIRVYKIVQARDLFSLIVKQAYHNGEPGILFLDAANRNNPLPHLYQLDATNPCGEQFLGPYENCCLGSINLAQHFGDQKSVDWETLRQSIETSTRFLDDVIDANAYVPAVPQLREAAMNARRIGLGIMGLADLMYYVGIRYGSKEGEEFAAQVMEFIRYHSMLTSIELAKERGTFLAINGSIYDPNNVNWQPPEPLEPFQYDWHRPEIEWDKVVKGIVKYGIRNVAQTTIAPTGTIATVAGCEGYGCEPVFALAYIRHVNDNGNDLHLFYKSPLFEKALIEARIDTAEREAIYSKVSESGSCQGIDEVPDAIKYIFVVSSDISAEEHVRMQGALQAFVDNSLSKTINFSPDANEEDVATAYQLAWKLGCKGLTVYVTGSRQRVVLETNATLRQKSIENEPGESILETHDSSAVQVRFWQDKKKPRPRSLHGYTYTISTPLGKAFITINENGEDHPFEVFINTAKAGSDTAAVSEAIGRLVSYILRLASPVAPRDRLKEIWRQLTGIGGGRSMGFGPNRVRSLPDGVAHVIAEYLEKKNIYSQDNTVISRNLQLQILDDNGHYLRQEEAFGEIQKVDLDGEFHLNKIGDLCPECGQATLVYEEGCRKCYTCGFSEC